MLADSHPAVPVQQRPQLELVKLDEQDSRLRAFSCPSGLHDWCSSGTRHDLPVQSGLSG
jgi:hypothetical protein